MLEKLFDTFTKESRSTALTTEKSTRSDQISALLEPAGETVLQHLRRHKGYAWQGQLVRDLEWSEAKTSRTLSEMEAIGEVNRYRVGRRKLVCLPEREPDVLQRS